jgi:hypothetical protein
MDSPPYSLEQILRVACQHPFYNCDARYPPSREMVHHLVEEAYVGSKGPDIVVFSRHYESQVVCSSPLLLI